MAETKQSKPYYENFTYLFVPFTTQKLADFQAFRQKIAGWEAWKTEVSDNRYLHRYVADKILGEQENAGHFRLDTAFAEELGVQLQDALYGTKKSKFQNKSGEQFPFVIANVELFMFNTPVGILAFELRFADNDPIKIAAAQSYLQKAREWDSKEDDEKTGIFLLDNPTERLSFVGMARKLLQDDGNLDFFFYAPKDNASANFLTYIDVPTKADYGEELFRLKWCHNERFPYDANEEDAYSENYTATKNVVWGLSASAVACLVNRTEDQRYFLENIFQNNFRKRYMLTYVLLLHQKYMMYLLLTKVSVGLEGNLKQLEAYKSMLYEFENHYMFSYISEVPQYQRFYDKLRRVSSLENLFRDVQEPLTQLTDIQRQIAEKEEKDRDAQTNAALNGLSLLAIMSALTDAVGFPSSLGWLIKGTGVGVVQGIFFALVVVVGGWNVYRLFFRKKR